MLEATLLQLSFLGFITAVFTIDVFVKLNYPFEYYAGIDHVVIGSIALYHAMVTLVNKYTGKAGWLLGKPPFKFTQNKVTSLG